METLLIVIGILSTITLLIIPDFLFFSKLINESKNKEQKND